MDAESRGAWGFKISEVECPQEQIAELMVGFHGLMYVEEEWNLFLW